MITVYCNYTIHNDDTGQCLEEGDHATITYENENEENITVKDAPILKITKDTVTIETDDFDEIEIPIENIEEWD